MWIKWEASNAETRYGWTEDKEVVAASTAHLNQGREVNLYVAAEMDAAEVAEVGLENGGLALVCTDDSRVEDFSAPTLSREMLRDVGLNNRTFAKLWGVTEGHVSRVVNGHEDLSPAGQTIYECWRVMTDKQRHAVIAGMD